jgi:hypothetical protein
MLASDPGDPALSRTYPLREDMLLQRRLWRLERVGWMLWGLLLVLCLLGLFANGWLSDSQQRTDDGRLTLNYQRFARSSASTDWTLQVQADARGRIRLEWGGGGRDAFDLQGITPRPQRSRATARGLQLEFAAEPAARVRLDLRLQATSAGAVHSWIALDGGQRLHLNQFIYP